MLEREHKTNRIVQIEVEKFIYSRIFALAVSLGAVLDGISKLATRLANEKEEKDSMSTSHSCVMAQKMRNSSLVNSLLSFHFVYNFVILFD